MKASLKLRDDRHHHHHHLDHHHLHHQNPLLRLKIPVSILNLPFISTLTTGDPKDLSFNLHSNFLSGPSLKLSYHPTTTTTQRHPISLSLKSGVGLFGSPKNSPLIISAHFNLFGDRNPSFSLQIKPQFGDFSLSKTTLSNGGVGAVPKENGGGGGGGDGDGFAVPEQRGTVIMRNIHNNCIDDDDDFFSGVAVKARTVFPVKNFAAVKFRWGVNFPADSVEKMKLPFLTVDKISIERVDEELERKKGIVGGLKEEVNGKAAELEAVKGICFWMRKEVEDLQVENNAIKERLEEMKLSSLRKNTEGSSNVSGRKAAAVARPSAGEGLSGFESWKNKKNSVEESGRRESKKFVVPESPSTDMEEELKRAIQAASSNKV